MKSFLGQPLNNTMDSQSNTLEPKSGREVPLKLNLGFSLGEIPDLIAYQGFSFLIFTFYSVVIGLPIDTVTIVFIIWSIFNAFNDPILGALSDRTRTKKFGGGRRRPWIISMIIPLPLVMVFLFTPIEGSDTVIAIYMAISMILFDTFYTTYSLNHTSLYPEMFRSDRAREEVGRSRRILMVVGLLVAFALPGIVITDLVGTDAITRRQYILCGAIFGVCILVTMLGHIKTGIRERPLEELQEQKTLSLLDSFKYTFKNKDFILIVMASTMNWYVFGILPMVLPIYASIQFDLSKNAFETTLLLVTVFLCSIPGVLFWSWLDKKIGSRQAFIVCMIFWAVSLIPLYFITEYVGAMIAMAFIGIGFGGGPYFIDRNISNVIDEDELRTHQRREASFFGVHAVFIRLATILIIICINIVFTSYNGWEEVDLVAVTPKQQLGLRLLMSIFPACALIIGVVFASLFSLNTEKVKEIQTRRNKALDDLELKE
ncbi:hypothetical protein NEF87_001258 [Candidatus Lokiarchaeum ossiferum]|uniref:MFS transporter n=1 Tax=Candidatus Lokiarchaeum ossiferum TaxID=2951803 RepID=A0ABY6HNT2_9ARCH|nr:hypothetical protein NEF87_001258 [Candidatus Lokiarchaeum sp. B-35]